MLIYIIGGGIGFAIGIGVLLFSVRPEKERPLRLAWGLVASGVAGTIIGLAATLVTSPLAGWSLYLGKNNSVHLAKGTGESLFQTIAISGFAGFTIGGLRRAALSLLGMSSDVDTENAIQSESLFEAIHVALISILLIGIPLALCAT